MPKAEDTPGVPEKQETTIPGGGKAGEWSRL